MRLKCPSVNVSCSRPNMKPATNTEPKSPPGSSSHRARQEQRWTRDCLGSQTGITCPAGSSLAARNTWLSFPALLKSLSEGLTATIINNKHIVKNSQTQFNDQCLFSAARMHEEAKTEQQLGLTLEEISDLHRSTS